MRIFLALTFFIILAVAIGSLLFLSRDLAEFYSRSSEAVLLNSVAIQKEETSAVKVEKPISILFVGDIMLSREIGAQIKREGDPRYPFLKIKDFLDTFDLRFANLESPISDQGWNQGSMYSFRADPKVVEGLTFAGLNVLSIANNHIWDWGSPALVQTARILKENGIVPIGAGEDEAAANKLIIIERGATKIGFLAYTTLYPKTLEATATRPGVSHFNVEKIKKVIGDAKSKADVLVVSLHWGEEYRTEASDEQKRIARALVDAGADLIVGHHPHVAEEVERYSPPSSPSGRTSTGAQALADKPDGQRDGWIAYSLGNFVFDQNFSSETRRGLILLVTLEGGKVRRIETKTVSFSPTYQPYLPTGE